MSCLAKRKTFAFTGAGATGDDAYLQEVAPWVQMPSLKGQDRMWRSQIPALVKQGYFGSNAKVGLVSIDEPEHLRTVERVIKPALAEAGHPLADQFRITACSPSDAASCQSQTSQAVLRFKTNGVTHVLFQPGQGVALFFANNAESQQYRPRYAIDTNMFPLYVFEGNAVPQAQKKGMVGIGWRPQFDIATSRYAVTPREKACFEIMKRGGEDVKDRNDPSTAPNHCDVYFAFSDAATLAGQRLTSGTLVAGLRGLGASWESVLSFRSDFTKGRFDAAFSYRYLAYEESCNCFNYKSDVLDDL
jgi:hypothetical protein